MGGLPVVSGRHDTRALQKAGFVTERLAGSHHILTLPCNPARTVTVPVHGNRDLKPGTLRAIVRQAGLAADALVELL